MQDRMGNSLSSKEVVHKSIVRLKTILIELNLLFLRALDWFPSFLWRRFLYALSGVKLTPTTTFNRGIRFFNPHGVNIGEDTIIGDHCFLDGRAALTIGNHTDIATGVLIYNAEHNIHTADFGAAIIASVTIGDYVFIGPRAIILPGVTIHTGAVVGAGAVVTKDVPAFTIVAGVPAKPIGERQLTNPAYRLGRPMLFQ